jgi:uncharacterized protein with NAD-binding domain and iron-sulfur cluster
LRLPISLSIKSSIGFTVWLKKKSPSSKARSHGWENSIAKAVRVLGEALDNYEQAHPHWRIEALVSLIRWSVKCLKHYLEVTGRRSVAVGTKKVVDMG